MKTKKLLFLLTVIMSAILFTGCEEDLVSMGEIQFSWNDPDWTYENERIVTLKSGETKLYHLSADLSKVSDAVLYIEREDRTLQGTLINANDDYGRITNKNSAVIHFVDMGRGNYHVKIKIRSSAISGTQVFNIIVNVEGSSTNPTDPIDPGNSSCSFSYGGKVVTNGNVLQTESAIEYLTLKMENIPSGTKYSIYRTYGNSTPAYIGDVSSASASIQIPFTGNSEYIMKITVGNVSFSFSVKIKDADSDPVESGYYKFYLHDRLVSGEIDISNNSYLRIEPEFNLPAGSGVKITYEGNKTSEYDIYFPSTVGYYLKMGVVGTSKKLLVSYIDNKGTSYEGSIKVNYKKKE